MNGSVAEGTRGGEVVVTPFEVVGEYHWYYIVYVYFHIAFFKKKRGNRRGGLAKT